MASFHRHSNHKLLKRQPSRCILCINRREGEWMLADLPHTWNILRKWPRPTKIKHNLVGCTRARFFDKFFACVYVCEAKQSICINFKTKFAASLIDMLIKFQFLLISTFKFKIASFHDNNNSYLRQERLVVNLQYHSTNYTTFFILSHNFSFKFFILSNRLWNSWTSFSSLDSLSELKLWWDLASFIPIYE
jgi:hypothetical protein